jgi:hypothetical protein
MATKPLKTWIVQPEQQRLVMWPPQKHKPHCWAILTGRVSPQRMNVGKKLKRACDYICFTVPWLAIFNTDHVMGTGSAPVVGWLLIITFCIMLY